MSWLLLSERRGEELVEGDFEFNIVNSVRLLEELKAAMRGKLQQWDCRTGQNSMIIRTD